MVLLLGKLAAPSLTPLIGFIAPLIAQTMALWGWAAPFGMSRVLFGLAIGVPWGAYAMIRGRWL